MISLVFSLAAQVVETVTRPWRNLIWYALHLYVAAWGVLLNCSLKLVSAPFRILTAIQRQSLLEGQLVELQLHIDHVVDKNRGLENLLLEVTKERQRVQEALELFALERKKAYERLKSREEELTVLSLKLEEAKVQLRAAQASLRAQKEECANRHGLQNILRNGGIETTQVESKGSATPDDGFLVGKLEDAMLLQGRGRAMASSLFSAALSTLVALIVWEAQDPCLPLVAALFTVVGVSLANVIHFFTKLQAKHGFDAIALISFNWFILGTLACPAFPYLARWLPKSIGLETFVAGLFGVSMLEDVGLSDAI